jgi:hypothetical protein
MLKDTFKFVAAQILNERSPGNGLYETHKQKHGIDGREYDPEMVNNSFPAPSVPTICDCSEKILPERQPHAKMWIRDRLIIFK